MKTTKQERHTIRFVLNTLSVLTFLMAFFLIVLTGFWINYPYKVIEFKGPMVVTPNKVHAGDEATFSITYCKYMNIPAMIQTSFEDSVIYSIPEVISSNKVGCVSQTILMTVPKGLPAESYIMTKTFEYQVNPLRKVRVSIKSEPFQIIK